MSIRIKAAKRSVKLWNITKLFFSAGTKYLLDQEDVGKAEICRLESVWNLLFQAV